MRTLLERFKELPDYRKNKVERTHPGMMLFFAMLAMLSGAQGYSDMALWMRERKRIIAGFLLHPFQAPGTGTLWNIFTKIDVGAVEAMMREWVQSIKDDEGERLVVSADGKHLQCEGDIRHHMLSLFLNDQKLVLAHQGTDIKSNEIPAMLELLEGLGLEKCIITMDAMHCQKNASSDRTEAA